MKVIIAGSRGVLDDNLVEEAVRRAGFPITEVVSGTARGVDQLGERWAARHGIPVRRFPADWNRYGRSAGIRRNEQMLVYVHAASEGGALIAIWDGRSRGTRHTIEAAARMGVKTFILRA
jgi:hypothetical protein